MKVILQKDVEKLGEEGDLVEVAPGYGRNYLIPRGFALEATPGNLKRLEFLRQRREERKRREEAEARQLAETLGQLRLQITAKVGEEGRLFGSVTATDIVEAVKAASGLELDRRRIELEEPIKQLGNYTVPVRLHPQVSAQLNVTVEAEPA